MISCDCLRKIGCCIQMQSWLLVAVGKLIKLSILGVFATMYVPLTFKVDWWAVKWMQRIDL